MNDTEARLDRLRGAIPARDHNARTIAALTSNPGCARRAVLDAAGVDKQRVASHAGFPAQTGQSQFAITRGNAFEAQVKANGCAELLRLLREKLDLPIPEVSYDDLESVGGNDSREVRHTRSRNLLARAAASGEDAGTLFDHPLLRLDVGGRIAYLEPDLIAFHLNGVFHVVEIKSFAVIDGQADGGKVAAAVTQGAVYVLALRGLLAELGYGPETVAHDVVLVCPKNFANRPTAVLVDVRKQLTILKRQLARLARIDSLVAELPPGLNFDLYLDGAGVPQRPALEVAGALHAVEARYAPECLDTGEMAYFCRHEARDDTASLGRSVRDELGGIESVTSVLGLAEGALAPAPDQDEARAGTAPGRPATRRIPGRRRMSTLTSLARAQAVRADRAQPIATVRHVHLHEPPLVLIPLTLAGEANAPQAAMVGDHPDEPRLLVVPQPRNRDQRFAFAASLASIVVSYIDGFTAGSLETVPTDRGRDSRYWYADAPQILVPNAGGISFLRLFGRSTRIRRPYGDYAVAPAVPMLGRWLTFFAERTEHPGSCLLLAATDALTLHWATGQSAVEDQNLAALLGWIDPPAGLTNRPAGSGACPGPADLATRRTDHRSHLRQRGTRPAHPGRQRSRVGEGPGLPTGTNLGADVAGR